MINHIAAKFIGLTYSAVPPEIFKKNHENTLEALRSKYPRFHVPTVNNIRLNLFNEQINTEQVSNIEVHMVSADGKFALKIGNQGVFLSVDGYITFEELLDEFKLVVESIHSTLSITHFSQVQLRNINLFKEVSQNNFEDIREKFYWGRQDFPTLTTNDFLCSGAATRHEYLSSEHLKRLQISSGVVLGGSQSYIPQDEWDIWRFRGGIPVREEVNLLIDITGVHHQAPLNEPQKQLIVKEYDWETVSEQLSELHKDINGVYSDIIIKET